MWQHAATYRHKIQWHNYIESFERIITYPGSVQALWEWSKNEKCSTGNYVYSSVNLNVSEINKSANFCEWTTYKICVLLFSINLVWMISHSKKYSARYYHKYEHLNVRYPLFLSGYKENPIFPTEFLKMLKFQI